ncbi:MAG TPA: ABC transporter permease [Solirubrobacteraceae bacterium]|nr:ABC transporter permease [Solirubrobacteraceae bacterium]
MADGRVATVRGRVAAGPLASVSGGLDFLREYMIVVCVLALFLVLTFTSDTFLTTTNLLNVLQQVAPVGLVAFALTFLLIVGEFDLSSGALFVLTGVLAAKLQPHLGTWPALLIAATAALAGGVINGLLVAYARINSFVCTLATSLMVAGLSNVITKGFLVTVNAPGFFALGSNELLGVKYSIWILVVAALLCGFVLSRTKFGRWLYAVGGNPEAARLSGINVRAMKVWAFAFSGLAAGIGGAIVVSRTATGQAGNGIDIVFGAFAAVVVGGTSVMGGRGAIWRTMLGIIFLALITNGFNLLQVEPVYQSIIQGAIILTAVAIDSLSRRAS